MICSPVAVTSRRMIMTTVTLRDGVRNPFVAQGIGRLWCGRSVGTVSDHLRPVADRHRRRWSRTVPRASAGGSGVGRSCAHSEPQPYIGSLTALVAPFASVAVN
jgi:hypothetical protein